MIISDKLKQGSEQWLNLRKGRATASQFSKIITPTGKASSQAEGYIRELVAETVAEDPLAFNGNKFTDWGNEMEPEARESFEAETGHRVKEVGFCQMAEGVPVGCSPDGLTVSGEAEIGDLLESDRLTGGLEIKCPTRDTHVGYLMDGSLPSAYKLQVHGSLAVTGLPVWHFYSYFPGLNPFHLEVEPDDFTELVKDRLEAFVIEYGKQREPILDAILPSRKEAQQLENSIL